MNKFEIYKTNINNIIIILFSSCNKIPNKKLLNLFKSLAIKDIKCYKNIYPWDYIKEYNSDNIIVYNIEKNHIQGWCNLSYNKINITKLNTKISYYTASLDYIVTREKPKINNIGSLILYFIKDHILNKSKLYYDENLNIKNINIDIFYLYSIHQSIPFYNKINFLHNFKNFDINNYIDINLVNHIFIYIPEYSLYKLSNNKVKKNLIYDSISLLHSFDVKIIKNKYDYNYYISNFYYNKNELSIDDQLYINKLINDNSIKTYIFRKNRAKL